MAHFAELDENNKVIRVIAVGNDEVAYNGDPVGETYCTNLLGGTWKQTSYNTRQGQYWNDDGTLATDQSKTFRNHFANTGYTYDAENDVFISKPPFPSWVLNSGYIWQPPVANPSVNTDSDGNPLAITWNETNQQWNGNAIIEDSLSDTTLIWDPITSSWS